MKKFLCLVLLLLVACSVPPPIPVATRFIASDSGKTVSIAREQILSVVLDSNASTGFVWNLVLEPDPALLAFESQEYATQGNAPGAGGIETWEFKAVGVGMTNLKLQYFRPWEPLNIAGEFVLQIQVK